MSTKKKKQATKSYTTSSTSKTSVTGKREKQFPAWVKKALIFSGATIMLAAAIAGFLFWKKNQKPDFSAARTEKTLVAKKPLLELMKPAYTGIDFQNTIIETEENNITNNINMYNGGGVAVADINNDGLPDIYFIASNGPNRLYLNEGDFQFKDITETAGLLSEDGFETAVTAADVNADGWLDFYICRGGPEAREERRNKLFINNQNLTFTERSRQYGLDDISASTGANFFDSDNDGDLDLYLLNYPTDLTFASKIDVVPGPNGFPVPNTAPKQPYDSDRFYRNDNGSFVDISQEAGIWNFAYGLSVSVTDFNRDGYTDIYVGNDFFQPDKLYINNHDNTFTDRIGEYFKHCTMATMGTELADFDNDGLIDLFAAEMLPVNNYRNKTLQTAMTLNRYLSMTQNGYFEPVIHNVLQRNNGNGTFSDVACQAGVFKTDWSWSGLLTDFNNDGYKDLYITNGYRREVGNRDFFDFVMPDMLAPGSSSSIEEVLSAVPTYKIRDFIFQNEGNWQFRDKGGDWMTVPATWSCGAAYADFDADGDIDLIVNNLEDPAFVYRNLSEKSKQGHYLQCLLEGSVSNPFGIGASVLIEYDGQKQFQENNPTRGIFSSVEHLMHFGLGESSVIERLTVRWPDGKFQLFENIPADQRLILKYPDASGNIATLIHADSTKTLFQDISKDSGIDFVHKENQYVDFEAFPLNPWMHSALGPLLAVGDVNGDGLDDVFIGSAFNELPALFRQMQNGKFERISYPMWEIDKPFEEHGAVFFDMEGDGDQDLFVVGGGAEAIKSGRDQAWQAKVYINTDGQGRMIKASREVLPDIREVGYRVAAFDYDKDGDQDIFMGGRITPDQWPVTPRSYILRNDRSLLVDVTDEIAPEFERCGMVTDLTWADLNNDQQPELIVVGEWMPVTIFSIGSGGRYEGGKFRNITAQYGLENSQGLWQCISTGDFDGDGDIDLATGNFGTNTRFTASAEEPLRVYAKDFDQNGTLDPIVAYPEDGKFYPLMQKDVLLKQIPSLKKKFLYADDYGKATVFDLWPKSDFEDAISLHCNELRTSWWENKDGKFIHHVLPAAAQSSPVHAIRSGDFNADGKPDLLMAGNEYGMDVETGRCDAGTGVFLAGDGKGNFTWINNLQSGFWAMHEARDLGILRGSNDDKFVVVTNNDGPAQVYKIVRQ